MRFRAGLLIGGAVGYVLGARGGREHYEQIITGWGKLRRSGPAQEFEQKVTHVAQAAKEEVVNLAGEQAQAVKDQAQAVKDKVVNLAGEQAQAVKDKVTEKVDGLADRESEGGATNAGTEPTTPLETTATLAGKTPGGPPDNGSPGSGD